MLISIHKLGTIATVSFYRATCNVSEPRFEYCEELPKQNHLILTALTTRPTLKNWPSGKLWIIAGCEVKEKLFCFSPTWSSLTTGVPPKVAEFIMQSRSHDMHVQKTGTHATANNATAS